MQKKVQEIYINLDDSGKLSPKENICVYGGLIFLSKKEKDKFITQYRSIVNNIKCKYCSKNVNCCDKSCVEIKNTNIKPKDKRWIINYVKKYYIGGLIIKNEEVYDHIKNNKAAKGRFLDYSIRRLIKDIIKILIKHDVINANKRLKVIINIDEQTTKSNGYYNLKDGLIEELKYGVANYNYDVIISPIINSKLDININYQNSRNSYVIQAADILAGTIRRKSLDAYNNKLNIEIVLNDLVDFKTLLP